MQEATETEIFGTFQVHAFVGEGGMATVELATNQEEAFAGQFLALKRLKNPFKLQPEFISLLIQEAKMGAVLQHSNIVKTLDLGSVKTEFYLAMEYIHGQSLEKFFEKTHQRPLDLNLATFVILEILRGLDYAHNLKDKQDRSLSLIHRDVTPGNILISYQGEVKLTDFGIAAAENRYQASLAQFPMGKLLYLPPEQIQHQPAQRQSDLYSLLCVWYELLCGHSPFAKISREKVAHAIINDPFPEGSLPLEKEILSLIRKGLSKNPQDRFSTAKELFDAIHAYFLREKNIDFSSRTTRLHFRSQLSQNIRSLFNEELKTDLRIIEKILNSTGLPAPKNTLNQTEVSPSKDEDDDLFDDTSIVDFNENATQVVDFKNLPPELALPEKKIEPVKKPSALFKKRWAFVLIAAAVAGFFSWKFYQSTLLVPSKNIQISLWTMGTPHEVDTFLQPFLFDKDSVITDIEHIFDQGYQRFSGDTKDLLTFDVKTRTEPEMVDSRSEDPDTIVRLWRDRFPPSKVADISVLIWTAPFFEDGLKVSILSKNEILIKSKLDDKAPLQIGLALSQVIASYYGAKVKLSDDKKFPLVPEGISRPQERPLYPQARAEVMAGLIPMTENKTRDILGLYEVEIGPKTAFELGWISKQQLAELLQEPPSISAP